MSTRVGWKLRFTNRSDDVGEVSLEVSVDFLERTAVELLGRDVARHAASLVFHDRRGGGLDSVL